MFVLYAKKTMDISLMQYNYRSRYLVVIDGDVYVYKHEKCKFDQPFLSFQAKYIFIGKSKVCGMTEFSGADDRSDFDGNTILLECEDNEYVYISGFEIFKFKSDYKIIDYISLTSNNMCPYTIEIGGKYTYFLSIHCKFFENDKIEEGTLLNATTNSLDPFVYYLGKFVVDSFEMFERSQIHTFYPRFEEDVEDEDDVLFEEDENLIETLCCNGTNEVAKIYNEKCVIC